VELEDLLQMLINPSEEGAPEDIFDQIRDFHTGAIAGKDEEIASSTEALAGLQSQLDAVSQELVEVKAFNFDSIMSAGTPKDGDEDLNEETFNDVDTEGELEDDDFFEKEDSK
jgi:hypothetical protein